MSGVIEFANAQRGRYAVCSESGGYSVFQLLEEGILLQVGDVVDEGDLEALTVQTYRIRGMGDVNIFAEKTRLTRSAAENWVKSV